MNLNRFSFFSKKFLIIILWVLFTCFCVAQESNKTYESLNSIRKSKNFFDKWEWKLSCDGSAMIWSNRKESFSWEGDVVGGFANGEGYLKFENDNKKYLVSLFFGADETDFKETGSSGNKYLGSYREKSRIREGKGVLIYKSSGNIYAGDFMDGNINGYAVKIVNNKIKYEGEFKNNEFHGGGCFYNNENHYFKGNFKNGKMEGFFTEYTDEAIFKGNFIDNKKEGLFVIEIRDIVCHVEYSEGKPILTNCNVYFPDGSIWEGSLDENFMRNGPGKLITKNGTIFVGEINNSQREGYGEQFQADGISYYGNWVHDKPEGYGEFIYKEDWYYLGEFKNGLFDGYGYLNCSSYTYEGNWKNGKRNGNGLLTLENLQYEGEWKDDSINGEGYISYSDGSYYEGSWKDNKRNGYGEYVWTDGSSYYGNWEDDFPHGEGEINLSNGDFYIGEIEYGYFSGAGTYIFANGDRYEGTFVENKKEGVGYYYFSNGNSYEGEFKNNQPNGKGRFYFDNGTFYEGEFENGKLKGKGSLFIPEDNDYTIITSDYWSENLIPTSGSVLFANGDEFVGTLKNGMPTDDGTWTTREERLNGRSTAQKLRDFYGTHQQTIEKAFKITESVINGIGIVATFVETKCPIPQVQVVAMAVEKTCDVTELVIAGTNIAIKTAVLNYDINEIKQKEGSSEEIIALKKQYAKDISGDALQIAVSLGFTTYRSIQDGLKAKKALEIYPNLKEATKTIEKTGELVKVAKSGKFSDKLVRGTVSLAYGKLGKKIIETYGDDAAKLLFKHGDNAMYALTNGGEIVLKIAKKGGEKALNVIFANGEDAINIITKNIDNLDDVIEFISKKGKVGLKLLEIAGDFAPNLARQFVKYGDNLLKAINNCGKKNIKDAIKLIDDYGLNFINVLYGSKPSNFKVIKYIFEKAGQEGIDNLNKNRKAALWLYKKYGDEASSIINNVGFPPPYWRNRPIYGKTQVDDVWNNASKNGRKVVRDPNTGKRLDWDKTQPRQGQWDMGHRTGEEYDKLRDKFYRGEISEDEFLREYRNPNNYYPENPSSNRSHKFEEKN